MYIDGTLAQTVERAANDLFYVDYFLFLCGSFRKLAA